MSDIIAPSGTPSGAEWVRSAELENEMFACAEQHLAGTYEAGEHRLYALVDEDDLLRREVLQSRGYIYREAPVFRWRRDLGVPQPEVSLPPGYKVRSMGDIREYHARAWASWRAFHPDEPDSGFDGGIWYANLQSAPLYRRDLDLIAISPRGEFASFCTVWFDDVTLCGAFEPVGTTPEHQRRGLGKAVIYEGLRRLKDLGAEIAFVGSGSDQASAFYTSIGFTERDIFEMWEKDL